MVRRTWQELWRHSGKPSRRLYPQKHEFLNFVNCKFGEFVFFRPCYPRQTQLSHTLYFRMRHATCDIRQNEKIGLGREGIYIIYSIYTYLYYIFLAFLPPFYQNVACRMCGGYATSHCFLQFFSHEDSTTLPNRHKYIDCQCITLVECQP